MTTIHRDVISVRCDISGVRPPYECDIFKEGDIDTVDLHELDINGSRSFLNRNYRMSEYDMAEKSDCKQDGTALYCPP